MGAFDDLVASRKAWINDVLTPWSRSASRRELLKAEGEWLDIAGKVAPDKTLWLWAWSRFPDLVHESLGIDESSEIEVGLKDGRVFIGFPDSRKSLHGQLWIWGVDPATRNAQDLGPFSIDDIDFVRRSATSN